jgi:predicted DNA repair protein MutK
LGQGIEQLSRAAGELAEPLVSMGLNLLVGVVAGGVVLLAVKLLQKLKNRFL